MKENNQSSLDRPPTQVTDLFESEEVKQLKEDLKKKDEVIWNFIKL